MNRTIIIGLDGGEEQILEKLPLQGIKNIINSGIKCKLTKDRKHAGWQTILTGKQAEEHGGFYSYIKKGTYETSRAINLKSYYANPQIIPLWDRLNNMNVSVGFLNVPTTNPAPKVNGFFIPGAGGGKQDQGNEVFGYPKGVKNILEELNYISDVRLKSGSGKIYANYLNLVNDLIKMTLRRMAVLEKLIETYDPQFIFAAFVGPDRIQHVLFKNIEQIINDNDTTTELNAAIFYYYKCLDQCIDKISQWFKGDNIIIVSDHGFAPLKQRVNLNLLLSQAGFLVPVTNVSENIKNKSINIIKKILPIEIKNILKKNERGTKFVRTITSSLNFDWERTVAFYLHNSDGIFINSKGRFPKGIVEQCNYDNIVSTIVSLINYSKELPEGFHAKKYFKDFESSFFSPRIPDIHITCPSHTLDSTMYNKLVCENKYYNYTGSDVPPIEGGLSSVFNGIHRSPGVFYAKGPDVEKAKGVFKKNLLSEVYNFIVNIYE